LNSSGMPKCKICTHPSEHFSKAIMLKKYETNYYKCDKCGFVQTEEPYWLDEAYSQAINRNDVGLVDRNIRLAKTSNAIISAFFNSDDRFIDYGGGYGLFVRLMRDAGFDFYRYDEFCKNLFAQDFEAEFKANNKYELLTAFEVFEHLANPLDEIKKMLGFSQNILFTTELLPASIPKPGSWWYYIPEYGQHVSFYTMKTLSVIAEKHSINLYSDGRSLHLFTARKVSPLLFRLVAKQKKVASAITAVSRRESLIPSDYEKITGCKIS
jgi:hypothetical protein